MIGRQSTEFIQRSDGVNELVLGMASSDTLQDGGFSPNSKGVNLIADPGVLHIPASSTDKSTNLSDNIIASAEDPTYTGKDRMFLDDSGNFYSWNGTALTKEKTASSDLFTQGTTDFVPFYDTTNGLNWYATTKAGSGGDLVRWDGTTGLIENYWSNASYLNQGALSAYTAWRPLLVFEAMLYIGDKNKLHRIAADLTVSNAILSLNYNETISALGKDNASGKMLIAVTTGVDYSGSRNGHSRIYTYDGYSNKATKVCDVNGIITAFKSIDTTTFVFYGNKIGYFTGSGIQYLRTLDFAIGDATLLIYPHMVTAIENTLYIAENGSDKCILAYGEVAAGKKIFYYATKPGTAMTCLTAIGGTKLGYSHATSKFYTFDTASISDTITGGIYVYLRKVRWARPHYINQIVLEFDDGISNATLCHVRLLDDTGTETDIYTVTESAGNTIYHAPVPISGIKTRIAQIILDMRSNSAGVNRVVMYHTPEEQKG